MQLDPGTLTTLATVAINWLVTIPVLRNDLKWIKRNTEQNAIRIERLEEKAFGLLQTHRER